MHTHSWEGRAREDLPLLPARVATCCLSLRKEFLLFHFTAFIPLICRDSVLPTCRPLGMAYSIWMQFSLLRTDHTTHQRGVTTAVVCTGVPAGWWWLPLQKQLVNKITWAACRCRNLVLGFASFPEGCSLTPLRQKQWTARLSYNK